jgi:hypothetical protein
MDKQMAVNFIREIRGKMTVSDKEQETINWLKDFISLKILKEDFVENLTVKELNTLLPKAMEDVFWVNFTSNELKNNVDLFRESVKARLKELIGGVEVSADTLRERIDENMIKCREKLKPSNKEIKLAEGLIDSILYADFSARPDVGVSFILYKSIVLKAKTFCFGEKYFFTAVELDSYKNIFSTDFQRYVNVLLAEKKKELERQLKENPPTIEELKTREVEMEAEEEVFKQEMEKMEAKKIELESKIERLKVEVVDEKKKALLESDSELGEFLNNFEKAG